MMASTSLRTWAAVLSVLAPFYAARAVDGPTIQSIEHFRTSDGPFSRPIEVSANTDHHTVAQGALMEVFLAVENHSSETTVSVNIDIDLKYAEGGRVKPFNLGSDREQILGPNEGVVFFLFFVVPEDAPLGTATFGVDARVVKGMDGNENPRVASDFVQFEVVP